MDKALNIRDKRGEALREMRAARLDKQIARDPQALEAYYAKLDAERKRNEDGTYV